MSNYSIAIKLKECPDGYEEASKKLFREHRINRGAPGCVTRKDSMHGDIYMESPRKDLAETLRQRAMETGLVERVVIEFQGQLF